MYYQTSRQMSAGDLLEEEEIADGRRGKHSPSANETEEKNKNRTKGTLSTRRPPPSSRNKDRDKERLSP